MRKETNIYKRKDGRWEGRYFKEYDINGKIKYSSVYAKTYGEVKTKLKDVKSNSITKNKPLSNLKFGCACLEWIEAVQIKVKSSTYSKYKYIIEKYVITCFGGLSLKNTNSLGIDEIVRKNKGLSAKTIQDIVSVIKLVVAYTNYKYKTNITLEKYTLPKAENKKIPVLSCFEQSKLERFLLTEIDKSKLGILICLYTGLRIGEICSLKNCDIDIFYGVIKVRHTIQRIKNYDDNSLSKTKIVIDTPKTENSNRDIPIPYCLLKLIKTEFNPLCKDNYFLSDNYKYIEPRTYQYRFKKYLEQAQIANVNFHALRHTFATRAIESGMDIKSLSEILGHSSVNITLQKYVHSSIEQKRKQINKLTLFNNF